MTNLNHSDILKYILEYFSDILAEKIKNSLHAEPHYSSIDYDNFIDELPEDFPLEINPIELLGYSKNNITEAKRITNLPECYNDKLSQVCVLLDEVQEYLFNN